MSEYKSKIGRGGRIVIPAPYRQRIGMEVGDEVVLVLEPDAVRILTPRQAVKRAQELVRRYATAGRSLADELIEERRREAE